MKVTHTAHATARGMSLSLFATMTLLISVTASSQERKLDVPYVKTPYIVVDHMLEMADVGPGDYVIDLGSGDGRIVNAAVLRGADGHGVDLDPDRVEEATQNARKERLRRRVLFLQQDVFDTDVSAASVVTMYLLPTINMKLRETLLETLEPGSRIVSHDFDMGDWQPDDWKSFDVRNRNHIIYYWVVPANVEGEWTSTIDDTRYSIEIGQHFQEIDIELSSDENAVWSIDDPIVKGNRIAFTADRKNRRFIFNGTVEDEKIAGVVQIYDHRGSRVAPWDARRE